MRMGGGLGYKIPTVFESEVDERDYAKLQPLQNVKAERSTGLNWDINFKKEIGKVELSINQSFLISPDQSSASYAKNSYDYFLFQCNKAAYYKRH